LAPNSLRITDNPIPLELQVEPEAGNKHGTAVAIVSGIHDVLQAWSDVNATPEVCGVTGLSNIFAGIVQPTVAELLGSGASAEVPAGACEFVSDTTTAA
jgi:hypothetical protein